MLFFGHTLHITIKRLYNYIVQYFERVSLLIYLVIVRNVMCFIINILSLPFPIKLFQETLTPFTHLFSAIVSSPDLQGAGFPIFTY